MRSENQLPLLKAERGKETLFYRRDIFMSDLILRFQMLVAIDV